jgi:hypothetical protein
MLRPKMGNVLELDRARGVGAAQLGRAALPGPLDDLVWDYESDSLDLGH